MLDQRAQFLLKTLVERYISEGQPVGSRALSKYPGLDLSPATIRNVMSDLEELGFVASPHTSAGRIPTSRGYRFFVDSLMTIKPLAQVEISQSVGWAQLDRAHADSISCGRVGTKRCPPYNDFSSCLCASTGLGWGALQTS